MLTVARTAGPYAISPGDEGGLITSASPRTGVMAFGVLDPWTFKAAIGNTLAIRISEVAGTGTDPLFVPRIRLLGPDGAFLADTQPSSSKIGRASCRERG